MINFADPTLVDKYGSWMRVQVAFYDFLFATALAMSPTLWKQEAEATLTAARAGFGDGLDFYEVSVKAIEEHWESPEAAWQEFLREQE
jgi:hypothetical protein